jgi:hypothetical protein
LILRSWDVCDVVDRLHKKVLNPEAMEQPTALLVLHCADRSTLWFDRQEMWRALYPEGR